MQRARCRPPRSFVVAIGTISNALNLTNGVSSRGQFFVLSFILSEKRGLHQNWDDSNTRFVEASSNVIAAVKFAPLRISRQR